MQTTLLPICFALACLQAMAQTGQAEQALPYKLTTGLYQYSGATSQNGQALDINLRHSSDAGNVWLGHYVSWAHELTQTRLGWDRNFPIGAMRLTPSLQWATEGAVTSSLAIETGESWFIGTGLGRTNLRDSVSLNFDPNDSLTLAGGYRWHETESLSLLLVRDNRLHPDQQHLHLIYRTPLPGGQRITFDLLHKTGLLDGEAIEKTGVALTYDWPRWFARLSYDPKANFTTQDLWRLAFGLRF